MVPLMTRLRPAAPAVVVSLLVLSACASTAPDPIALPSKDAAPIEVLGAYMRALKAGDCKAAQALATTAFASNGELCGRVKVKSYTPVGVPATRGDQANFSMNLITEGGDASMPDGLHTWFYTLALQADGAWRLVGGGSGP